MQTTIMIIMVMLDRTDIKGTTHSVPKWDLPL